MPKSPWGAPNTLHTEPILMPVSAEHSDSMKLKKKFRLFASNTRPHPNPKSDRGKGVEEIDHAGFRTPLS